MDPLEIVKNEAVLKLERVDYELTLPEEQTQELFGDPLFINSNDRDPELDDVACSAVKRTKLDTSAKKHSFSSSKKNENGESVCQSSSEQNGNDDVVCLSSSKQNGSDDVVCLSSSKQNGNDDVVCQRSSTLNEIDDVVCQLMDCPFWDRPLAEQIEIVKNGRPNLAGQFGHPDKKAGKVFSRHLTSSIYSNFKWVTLSVAKGKIYCWPCMLFPVRPSLWNGEGYFDLKNISRAVAQHAKTKQHILSCVSLTRFKNKHLCSVIVEEPLVPHVKQVAANREVFKRALDGVMLCIRQNRTDITLETFDYMFRHNSELEYIWCELRENPSAVNRFIAGLYCSLSMVVQKDHHQALNQATYFSFIINHHAKERRSVSARFVDSNGDMKERLLDVVRVGDKTADTLFSAIDSLTRQYYYRSKLIAHSYSGGCLSMDQISTMQQCVESVLPESLYVNCVYHRLCDVIADGAYNIPEAVSFFSVLRSFPKFITDVLKVTTNARLGIDLKPDSDLMSSLNFIFNNREGVIVFLNSVTRLVKDWTSRSYFYATLFKESDFLCLLITYKEIFERVEDLNLTDEQIKNDLYRNTMNDANTVKTFVEQITRKLSSLKEAEGIAFFLKATMALGFKPTEEQVKLFNKCAVNAFTNFESRYNIRKVVSPLFLFELLDSRRFDNYTTLFPKTAFEMLTSTFGKLLDLPLLKSELEVVYGDSTFRVETLGEIARVLRTNNLDSVLTETAKLLIIARSIPPTTGNLDSSTVTVTELQRNIMEFADLNLPTKYALPYVHKGILIEMEQSLNWYEDVMKQFAQSEYAECLALFQ